MNTRQPPAARCWQHATLLCAFLSFAGLARGTPVPPNSAESPSIYKDCADRLFMVQRNDGGGSGFFCEIEGKTVAMTNAHVLSGSRNLTFTTPGGETIAVAADQFHVAAKRDLAFFPVKTARPGMKLCTRMNQLNIGDDVVCFGNSAGESAITEIKGKITGIGPDLIEVDAPFIHGNSGSPVIHVATGEMIGVATKYETAKDLSPASSDTRFREIRRFCARLDGSVWKAQTWHSFSEEAAFISRYSEHADQIAGLATDLLNDGLITLSGYDRSSVSLRTVVRSFLSGISNPNLCVTDRLKAQQSFLTEIEHQSRKGPFDDFTAIRKKAAAMASFHHRELLNDVVSLREDLSRQLKDLRAAQTGMAEAFQVPKSPPGTRVTLGAVRADWFGTLILVECGSP